jgi:hypothetical protein
MAFIARNFFSRNERKKYSAMLAMEYSRCVAAPLRRCEK